VSPEGAPERKQRVLVIDDEEQIRRALKSVLSARHYEVDLAETAERGLELTAEHTPDIIVLDLSLPDMSGLEACKRLREWFAAIERYPRQLHEMEQGEYLDMKRKEYLRQQSELQPPPA